MWYRSGLNCPISSLLLLFRRVLKTRWTSDRKEPHISKQFGLLALAWALRMELAFSKNRARSLGFSLRNARGMVDLTHEPTNRDSSFCFENIGKADWKVQAVKVKWVFHHNRTSKAHRAASSSSKRRLNLGSCGRDRHSGWQPSYWGSLFRWSSGSPPSGTSRSSQRRNNLSRNNLFCSWTTRIIQ